MAAEGSDAMQKRIRELEKQLAEARARIPKHDVPAALIEEIDDLDEELARLRPAAVPKSIEDQIAEVKARLAEAQARVPKHSVPAALIAELDELDEELAQLQAREESSS